MEENQNIADILQNKNLMAVIIIAIVIALGLILYIYSLNKNPIESLKIEIKTERQLQEQAADIIKSKDFSRCNEIEDNIYKTVCINNIALNLAKETQDIFYCQKIDNKLVPIFDCESQVIIPKSIDKEDIDICMETKDEELQKQCKNNFWPSLSMKKENVKLCENVSDGNAKDFCYDNYIFQKEFMASKFKFDCSKFKSQDAKSDCQKFLNNLPKMDSKTCLSLKSGLFSGLCMLNNFRR